MKQSRPRTQEKENSLSLPVDLLIQVIKHSQTCLLQETELGQSKRLLRT